MIDIVSALLSLKPNAKWNLRGSSYEGLDWVDQVQIKPTESEINAEIARLRAEYEVKEYQRQRAAEYPSIADQLDTLYHGGYDVWKAQVKAVKDKYPK